MEPALWVLWRAGSGGAEGGSDLAREREHGTETGLVGEMVDAPVVGWRVICEEVVGGA